jgi:hypothetical protein
VKAIFLIVLFSVLLGVGCHDQNSSGCHSASRLTDAQSDYLEVTFLALQFNAIQTNWTMVILPRTNSPVFTH